MALDRISRLNEAPRKKKEGPPSKANISGRRRGSVAKSSVQKARERRRIKVEIPREGGEGGREGAGRRGGGKRARGEAKADEEDDDQRSKAGESFRPWKLSRDRAKGKESAERLQERGDKGRREKRLLVLLIKGIQRRDARSLITSERRRKGTEHERTQRGGAAVDSQRRLYFSRRIPVE